ncbi:MAG TPA: alanine--glyoxylate aminotransferase family protein [Candidatus Dormibacteraeota bacterium]|nr:alanine--glyoxylate aminotransferase family protein [Candidatus Dormibacteraeota bacterium]
MSGDLLFIPGPVTCAPEVMAAMAEPMVNHRGERFSRAFRGVREKLAAIYQTEGEVLVLGASGTGGLEAAVANLFSPGDYLLSCPVGVFGRRLASIARTYGAEVEVLETEFGQGLDPERLAQRLRDDRERRITGILLTHNETSTGVQNHMHMLARAMEGHPALRVVDSVSGLGASPMPMDELGFDAVVGASQKVLAAPPGLAFVALSARAWHAVETARMPRFYLDFFKAREFGASGETPWTPPISQVFALDVALDRYHAEGAANVHARHAAHAAAIRAGAERLGIQLYGDPAFASPTVVTMHVPIGVEASPVLRALREQHGIVLAGGQGDLKGKIFRMGTMGAITLADVERAIAALGTVLKGQGYQPAVV